MQYSVKMWPVEGQHNSAVKARGYIVFDDGFKVDNVTLVENSRNGQLFVSMPSYRTNAVDENGKEIYRDVCHPITREFRESLYANIFRSYEEGKTVTVYSKSKKPMRYTVNLHLYERENSTIKALASVVFEDSFVINSIALHEDAEGKRFVTMPGVKTSKVYDDGSPVYAKYCHPVDKDFRENLVNAVISKYNFEVAMDKALSAVDLDEPTLSLRR